MIRAIRNAITTQPSVRALLHAIERHRPFHLAASLLGDRQTRRIYWNYLMRRRQMREAVLARGALPRNLYIEGTNVCNADCVFCGYGRMQRPKLVMSMDLFRSVIDQYVALGGKAIGFTPIVGDPMIDRLLFERLDYLEAIPQIKYAGFYTNSIALTPEKTDRLFTYTRLQLNMNISFGGFDRDTYKAVMGVDRFEPVRENVLYLLAQLESREHPNFHVKLDYRCPDLEAGRTDPFIARIEECIRRGVVRQDSLHGVFDSFGGMIGEENLAAAGLRRNIGLPKMGPCEILFTKPIVLADGRVNACAERDLEATLIIGNLNKESLKDILTGPRRQALMESFYRNRPAPVCQGCTVYQSIYNPRAKVWSNQLNWEPAHE